MVFNPGLHSYYAAKPSFMNDENIIRVGLIGAGGIVKQRHLPGLRELGNVRISAVANASLASAEAFCKEHAPEARPVARWQDVAMAEDVDVVWIGAHPSLHHDATCLALESEKHVFTQARMAATLAEAERMLAKAQEHPELVTAICPAPHPLKTGAMVKRLLAEGAIGRPHQMVLHSFTSAWLDAAQPAHWRQRVEASGVQILTLGIYIEVLQQWLGPVVEVEARGQVVIPDRQGYEVRTPDFVNVLARFQSGLEGVLMFSGVAAHAPTDKLQLFGTEGTLVVDFGTDEISLGRAGGPLEPVPVPLEMQAAWTVERDFIRAVMDENAPRPRPDFTEGLAYMRVVDAVWTAMRGRTAVRCGGPGL